MPAEFPELPGSLAGPLHILPPWTEQLLWISAAALLILGLFLAAAYMIHSGVFFQNNFPTPDRLPESTSATAAIDALRRKYTLAENYREGCHALAALMKSHFERNSGLELKEKTFEEMERDLRGRPVEFFRQLTALQFQRENPSADEFRRVCRRAGKLTRSRFRERKRVRF